MNSAVQFYSNGAFETSIKENPRLNYHKFRLELISYAQRMEVYRPKLKTISWIPRVLCHFINAAIVNSFIWYRAAFPEKPITHYKFRDQLVDEMVRPLLEKKLTAIGWTYQGKEPDQKTVVKGGEQTKRRSLCLPRVQTR